MTSDAALRDTFLAAIERHRKIVFMGDLAVVPSLQALRLLDEIDRFESDGTSTSSEAASAD